MLSQGQEMDEAGQEFEYEREDGDGPPDWDPDENTDHSNNGPDGTDIDGRSNYRHVLPFSHSLHLNEASWAHRSPSTSSPSSPLSELEEVLLPTLIAAPLSRAEETVTSNAQTS